MKPYIAYILITLKLTWRDRMVVFFNYMFPMVFFFLFAYLNKAEQGGAINTVYASVLVIGILGNGFFGGGIRAVVEREQNILRRFKVAPITPAPILVSAIVVGLINFLPSALIMFAIAHFQYGMRVPTHWLSALVLTIIATVAFRALGQIIASVANSMAESQIIIQTLYFPMMFLSGATFPISMFPDWLQIVTQFIPATHLYNGMQDILIRGSSLGDVWQSAVALILTTALGMFISMKLFRWEKDEKLQGSAKLWILAVMAPFFLVGMWQAYSKDNLVKSKEANRLLRRSRSLLIEHARLFVGDGKIIESGAVLIRDGKIAQVFSGAVPDSKLLRAEVIEGQGKTLLPGLIDSQVFLSAPGGIYEKREDFMKKDSISRPLAAYLFAGVTSVLSGGEAMDSIERESQKITRGERLGTEVHYTGPLFTTKDGPGTEGFRFLPANVRETMLAQFTRTPSSAAEAKQMVRALKAAGVVAIKAAVLDTGYLSAIAEEARAQKLPLMVMTSDSTQVLEAVNAGAAVILSGSGKDRIPDETWKKMVDKKIAYMPLLAVREGQSGNLELLDRSLVQQIGPPDLIAATKKRLGPLGSSAAAEKLLAIPADNLRRAYGAGVQVLAGSGAGSLLVFHGAGIQRELQLWVNAGLPTHAALQAATSDAAALLGIANRTGAIRANLEASLLLVNGNPLQRIEALEEISLIILKGERVVRGDLLNPEEN
ncbi:MAG: ABC transporter permease [Acidobacteria bacterium]|nr:ABC transporter permease [Acidobacteriota bacterium]